MFFRRAFFFVLLALATGLVTAKSIALKRQTTVIPNIPPSCSTVCAVFSTLQASADPAQLCTQANSASIQSCANCIMLIGGDAVLGNDNLMNGAQRAANAFVAACGAASRTIPRILISDPLSQTAGASATGNGAQSGSGYMRADLRAISSVMAAGFLGTIVSFI